MFPDLVLPTPHFSFMKLILMLILNVDFLIKFNNIVILLIIKNINESEIIVKKIIIKTFRLIITVSKEFIKFSASSRNASAHLSSTSKK